MDFYVILGLPHGATDADIKRAYRRLARRFHPDINPGDRAAEARVRQILEAYETLIDPERRHRYDLGCGADLHQDVQLGFEEALHGTQRNVTVTRREVCRTCAGTGRTRAVTGSCLV